MSKKLTLLILSLFLVRLVSGQETDSTGKKSYFSVSVESPFFYKDWWEYSHNVLTVNIEYLKLRENKPGLSFVLGFGSIISKYEGVVYYQDPYIAGEMNFLFGKKNHYFEIGFGPGYATSVFFKGRFGYRLQLGKRLLFRIAYTPAVYLRMHIDTEEHPDFTGFNALSVGLGYRFGINTSKEKWNTNWRWLSGMQLNYQPFFKYLNGYSRYYGEVDLELLIYSVNKIKINGIIGFGYGDVTSFAFISVPFGVELLYGRKNHFFETGMKVAWLPNENFDDGKFFTLQPELGYRFCPGKHFMVHVAYTPYWWQSDNNDNGNTEQKFAHSITIGIGWRFH